MPQMIAEAPCYLNDRLYAKGDVFEYDGPPSRAFHPVGEDPGSRVSFEHQLDQALLGKPGNPPDSRLTEQIQTLTQAIKLKEAQLDQHAKTIERFTKAHDESSQLLKMASEQITALGREVGELKKRK